MKFAFILFASLISLQAHAGILFEPMVSYESGSNNIEFTTAGATMRGMSSDKSTNSAVNYGARLGYLFSSGFWFAGDYSAATSGKSKFDLHEDSFDRTAMGVDLGMWNGRWNFWLGYNISDKLEFTQATNTEKEYVSGTSMKVGIGYLLFNHIAFNIEYTYRNYTTGDEKSSDIAFSDFSTYTKSFTQQSYSAGLSFPF
ncbi:outer membrane beta-barrel protein [Bdellovibrio svalbardensis]|uniref:Outer membrane protein beta-barrel domain-containing protein n=1 Tax=Bdellovibrio svalbardensis TaxID=2972972 RepID=A0ABT6DHJ3_9BACT|nr:outer membrane beta-barrel protein [Bdellovibrio svalbardensis]MDG0816268.1 hypothetical protein [Bdellovibrio svalbardensis]